MKKISFLCSVDSGGTRMARATNQTVASVYVGQNENDV